MKTSEEIKQFLDFIKGCRTKYEIAHEAMRTEERREQDFIHAIEFETHVENRSKTCTKLRACLMERRRNKDIVEELEPVIEYISNPQNKKCLDQLTQILGRVRKAEKYHENRSYHPRVEKQ
ncbi:MAG: hypothetical protein IJV14_11805 [Lachnospiraceae bacterium]|nr:hypothetical protein [Lachnospiraceae bacterium]